MLTSGLRLLGYEYCNNDIDGQRSSKHKKSQNCSIPNYFSLLHSPSGARLNFSYLIVVSIGTVSRNITTVSWSESAASPRMCCDFEEIPTDSISHH